MAFIVRSTQPSIVVRKGFYSSLNAAVVRSCKEANIKHPGLKYVPCEVADESGRIVFLAEAQ